MIDPILVFMNCPVKKSLITNSNRFYFYMIKRSLFAKFLSSLVYIQITEILCSPLFWWSSDFLCNIRIDRLTFILGHLYLFRYKFRDVHLALFYGLFRDKLTQFICADVIGSFHFVMNIFIFNL